MIDLLFTLFNAALFIGILLYVFWVYGMTYLKENILAERFQLVQLHIEHKNLSQEQLLLEDAILHQERLAQNLFKKINQWRNGVDVATRFQDEREHQLRGDVDKKVMVQRERYALRKAASQITPLVVEQLRIELKERYQGKQGHAYIGRIVQDIAKQ